MSGVLRVRSVRNTRSGGACGSSGVSCQSSASETLGITRKALYDLSLDDDSPVALTADLPRVNALTITTVGGPVIVEYNGYPYAVADPTLINVVRGNGLDPSLITFRRKPAVPVTAQIFVGVS